MPEKPPSPSNFPSPPCRDGLAVQEQGAPTSPGLPLLALPGNQDFNLATKRGRCHCLSVDKTSEPSPAPAPSRESERPL